ncbi:PREDICTED: microtubule-associated protein 10, partial [Nestor notabilis]|uniref:microtubule-associated protein 10 n=1 Tax=Nestor notabilis TaxID=176057 RepID=UPI00052363AB
HEPAKPHLPPAAVAAGQWEHVEAWGPQEKDKGQSPPRPSAGPSLLHPTSPPQLCNVLGQLPVLSALLAELSVFTHSAMPAAVHPPLAWLYRAPGSNGMASQARSPSHSASLKPAEAPVEPGGSTGAASPQLEQGHQEATSAASSQAGRGSTKAVPQVEVGSERNCGTKENRPPRKKLLYGLTNTLRLRLQQINPDKLIIHERREQYRKKQMEMMKERNPLSKRKLLRSAGEQHVISSRHCSKGDGSKRKDQFDKAVQTSLQNSGLPESISVTEDVSSDLQKQDTASSLKNDEIASKEHPCKVSTAPVLEETLLKSAHKEKHAKAQLPAAFPSDANAEESNEEAIHLIHHKTTEHDNASVISDHKPSPSRSAGDNSEFIYSDDFVTSPENTVYSEDFTSAECTDRDSEAFDSSPEPLWLESPKQGCSDMELESSRSRISKISQRAESNFPTVSKEENRGKQNVKQVSTLRSKQVRSHTDPNIGKGQTSAGKCQSVTQVSSYLLLNMSELSVLENSMSDKEEDDFFFCEKYVCFTGKKKRI